MKITLHEAGTRDSNSWVQKATIDVEVTCGGDMTTGARAKEAIKVLDEVHAKVKAELTRLANGKSS